MEASVETEVLIIGGGATGTGIARDLALRGIQSLVVEKGDINSGASGGNHGLLHSGARYVANDAESARECMEESEILRQTAPHCIDDCGGLFVAVQGDDERYVADFPDLCKRAGIDARAIPPEEAREMEPLLAEETIAAFGVNDGAIDPFMLCLENISHARALGTRLLCHTQVVEFERTNHCITRVWLEKTGTGERFSVEPRQVINAAGAWAGKVAALAGATTHVLYSMGTLLVTQSRMTQGVINRLRPPSDADILVPGGTVSILGTTSVRVNDPDRIRPTVDETNRIVEQGSKMIPSLEHTRYIRAYSGVRPLVSQSSGVGNDRTVSRGFVLLDHASDHLDNFTTITGGKLTTFRLMAEKTADLVAARLGNKTPCTTKTAPLPSTLDGKWTEPGIAPSVWFAKPAGKKDRILCECEMISESTIDAIAAALRSNNETPDLLTIGRRSRLGKGPCQGAFCSTRVLAHMYNQGALSGPDGVDDIKAFLDERWKGQQAIFWGDQLVQAELTEAMHCGLFDLELAQPGDHGHDH
jgi:glycerol-3-phosphate dehydrogenase